MNRLLNMINSMDTDELRLIQRDLYEGNIGYLVRRRLFELDKDKDDDKKVCPVCGTKITETNDKFTLVFGPPDFRKKASFDEADCLRFFVSGLGTKDPEAEQRKALPDKERRKI
jgi:hypothetical protein